MQRVLAPELSAEQALAGAERLEEDGGHATTAALLRLHAERQHASARQGHLAERFTAAHPGIPVATVPALPEDVHDLTGLREIGDLLASQGAP